MVGRRTAAMAAGVWIATATCRIASGQTGDQDKALALKLFDEGRALLTAGKVDDACHKLEESRRLDPLPGTLLNVAVCHERQGRGASATAEFREARALAERDHRDDRIALVDQHLKALEGKVSNLVIVVPPEADQPDLVLSRDGTPVGRAAWGSRIPVDPGEHVIEATASGKKSWRLSVTVGPGGDVQTVTVSRLEDSAPAAPAPAAEAPPAPAPPVVPPVAQPASPPAPPAALAPEHPGLSTRRTLAIVSAGVGVVGVGLGTAFGLTAISKHNDPQATCSAAPCTKADSLNHDAGVAADVSTVSFAVGLVGLGVGAFLWLGDSGGDAARTAVRVSPVLAPGRAGIDVGGRF